MQNSKPYTALIVDDHPVVRMAVEMLLKGENISVVGKTDNGADAVQILKNLTPDIVVLDIAIPLINGLDVITRARAMGLPVKILIFTSQSASSFVRRCRLAGASGFVEKNEDLDDLLAAIRAIRAGYTFFPAEGAFDNGATGGARDLEVVRIASLSDREMMVLVYLAKGFSNAEIATELTLSNKTISTYKMRLLEKLGVKTLVDLIGVAQRNNLIE